VIEFVRMSARDAPLLHEWLRRPHVRPWWGEPEADDEQVERYLIAADGRPVGMIQTYIAADFPEWERIVQVGTGVAGLDLLIGEEDLLGRGLGPRVLTQFARDVVFARTGIAACVATVEEGNRRSWRAFEKAGFRHVRDVEEDGRPHRLMRLDRPA
jgi:RimJ/RimL family protein N-acetyltransferase